MNGFKAMLAATGLFLLIAPLPSTAAEWSRDTLRGGEITRSVTRDGRFYFGETTRVGKNGATYTAQSRCHDGVVDRCRRTYTATGPEGRTRSGSVVTARGVGSVRSFGLHAGPGGDVGIGFRWRRR